MKHRVLSDSLNGRLTYHGTDVPLDGYDDAWSHIPQSNAWSSTENNANNAWNVNFSSGNVNNNNKNNSNVVRPSAALDELPVPDDFLLSVFDAYRDCMKGKGQSTQCIEYQKIAYTDLPVLARQLWYDCYAPTTSTCFLVSYPKWREVFAANFRDRIVHHWVCHYLEPLFEQRFREQGDVSFNCRKGYGTNAATTAVFNGIRKVTECYQKDAWVFKGDIVGFFMSIDKDVMWRLMERFIMRKYHGEYKDIVLRVTRIIIYHRPELDCILNSPVEMWCNLASNKSLHRNVPGKGMAIGNLTTQLFANFYLSWLDMFVQWVFRGRNYHYARFVDDFVIVCDDERYLKSAIPRIRQFLLSVLRLKLHQRKHYFQKVSHGVAFVGAYMKNGRIYLSNRTLARLQERIYGFSREMAKGGMATMDVARVQSVLNSYLGFCKGKRCYRRKSSLMRSLSPEFYNYFYIEGHYQVVRTKIKYRQLNLYLKR